MSIARAALMGGICLWAAQASAAAGTALAPTWLITEEEAALFRLPANARVIPAAVRAPGPRIDLKAPQLALKDGQEVAETEGDAELLAAFLKTREEVDMDKLEVELRNGNRFLSLTERLRPYLLDNRLEARHFYIPEGKFEIAIRIEDKKGRPTEKNSLMWANR
jgi:hypothetical protein